MRRWLSVLFWSVIAAAFIGPGTVTTAASAGASHGLSLLWALAFSTFACVVLQEAAGRLRLQSGRSLGAALGEQFPGGLARALMMTLVVGAILVGNAAYEAGNILGAVAGAGLVVDWPGEVLTLGLAGVAALLLWCNAPATVARILGAAVALMGLAFLGMALSSRPDGAELVRGLVLPSLPAGSGLLAVALVGTTVVPYNLFLGSGLARDQDLATFRFGLIVAVILGGLISMGIVVVGTRVAAPFSFEALAEALESGQGPWAAGLFGLGLLCAGLSSAVTAPLAAALTARSLFGGDRPEGAWGPAGWRYRAVWGSILAVGLGFGLSGVRPVPVIILAQASNGVVLPAVAIYLLMAVNDRRLMGSEGLNGRGSNLSMAAVTLVALLLGVSALGRALAAAAGVGAPRITSLLVVTAVSAVLAGVPLARRIGRLRAT